MKTPAVQFVEGHESNVIIEITRAEVPEAQAKIAASITFFTMYPGTNATARRTTVPKAKADLKRLWMGLELASRIPGEGDLEIEITGLSHYGRGFLARAGVGRTTWQGQEVSR